MADSLNSLSKLLNEKAAGLGSFFVKQGSASFRTEETEKAKSSLFSLFKEQPAGLSSLFKEQPARLSVIPKSEEQPQESWGKDLVDAFTLGTSRLFQGGKNFFFSALPNMIFRDVKEGDLISPGVTMKPGFNFTDITSQITKEGKAGLRFSKETAEQYNLQQQNTKSVFNKKYEESKQRYAKWLLSNPELQPKKKYEKPLVNAIKEGDPVLKDPMYYGTMMAETIPFTVGVMGVTAATLALTKNPQLAIGAGLALAIPIESQDLYEDLIDNGASEEQAADLTHIMGPAISAVEVISDIPVLAWIGIDMFTPTFRKEAVNQVVKLTTKNVIKKGITNFSKIEATETIEEIVQEGLQNATVNTINKSRKLFDNIPETALRTLVSTFPLALLGGANIRQARQLTEQVKQEAVSRFQEQGYSLQKATQLAKEGGFLGGMPEREITVQEKPINIEQLNKEAGGKFIRPSQQEVETWLKDVVPEQLNKVNSITIESTPRIENGKYVRGFTHTYFDEQGNKVNDVFLYPTEVKDKFDYKETLLHELQHAEGASEATIESGERLKELEEVMKKSLTPEQFIEQAEKWKSGMKEKFDEALFLKNVNEVRNLLPEVPAEYQQRFADDINNVLGERVIGKEVEKKYITRVKEMFPQIEDKVAGQHIPRSTSQLAQQARNTIENNIEEAEHVALTGADDKAVATASELINYYADKAATAEDTSAKIAYEDKMAKIANTIAPKLTEAGRTVQAAVILGHLTPEGIVRYAASQIQEYNRNVEGQKGKSLDPFLKKVPELKGEQAAELYKKAENLQKITDPQQRAESTYKFQDEISDLIPSPTWKKVINIWKAGLLTGIKTSGLNIMSTTGNSILETVKDIPAVAVDSVASLFTGKRSVAFTLKGMPEGTTEGFQKGWKYLKTGYDERNAGLKYDYKKVNYGTGAFAKKVQAYEQTVFRILATEDQPFYYGAKAKSIYGQAIVESKNLGLTGQEAREFISERVQNPTDDMIKYAALDAEVAIFTNKTVLGEVGSAIQQKGGVVGNFVVPFSRTPSAVAMQVINYSPVGIVKTIAQNISSGKFDQRLFAQGIARGITGTAIMYIGTQLMAKGLLALNNPDDERTQEQWKLEGKKPNSIKVGDKWRTIQAFGPSGTLLLIGGHLQQGLKETGSITQSIARATWGGVKSFTEQTFLQGVKNFSDAINDPERFDVAYFGNLLGSFIPTIISDVAKAKDTYERKARSVIERVQARIPFYRIREQLQPQIDVFGQQIKRGGNFLETMIDPTRPSKIKDSPVLNEVKRLGELGYKVSPTLLGTKAGYDSLTKEENTYLLQRAGQITESKLSKLIESDKYKKLPDDKKANVIDKFVKQSKDVARAEMVMKKTVNLQGSSLKEELSKQKTSGLVTRDVFNLYLKLR